MKSLRGIACCACCALAACASGGEDYPIAPQGGTAGGGGTASSVIRGRVCLISDPRFLATCATTGAGGLTVSIGNGTATTTDNGAFVMNTPTAGATSTITAIGAGVVPATTPLTATATIPVINQALFDQMVLATGITTTSGTGSILASVVRNGEPVANVNASATPAPAFGPFFDGATPAGFTINPTGAQGVVFFSGAMPNTPMNVTFTDTASQTETTVGGVQVIDGGITFVEGILP